MTITTICSVHSRPGTGQEPDAALTDLILPAPYGVCAFRTPFSDGETEAEGVR
jgi:hypothetical protein